jgi:hypothetical protein
MPPDFPHDLGTGEEREHYQMSTSKRRDDAMDWGTESA